MEREHKASLSQKIDQMAQNLTVLPEWVENIQPLNSTDFPDSMHISDLIGLDSKSRRADLTKALINMGIIDENKLDEVSWLISRLQQPTVGENGYKICDHSLTIGELKTLNVEQLKLLNGFDKTTEPYKAAIIGKLFGLRS